MAADDLTRRVAEIRQTVYTDWRTVIEDVEELCDAVTELQRKAQNDALSIDLLRLRSTALEALIREDWRDRTRRALEG